MIESYSNHKHYSMLVSWLKARGIAEPNASLFSNYGLVVDGIALGFLFKTNSKQAYIDQIATDPNSDPKGRDFALKVLIEELCSEAKQKGFKVITILASLDKMKTRLTELKFTRIGDYTLYFKNMGV
jgi:hypothetical protein